MSSETTAWTSKRPAAVSRRFTLRLLVVVLLALLFRLVFVLSTDYNLAGDGHDFDRLGVLIANGDGMGESTFPNTDGVHAFRAPLYPAVVGAVYFVAGDNAFTAARVANAVLGAALVGLIGLLGRRLWSDRTGLLAASLAAAHPMMVMVGSPLALEPLLAALTVATVLAVVVAIQDERNGFLVAAGLSLGLTILTRELGFLLIPALVGMLVSAHRARHPDASIAARLRAPAILLLTGAMAVVPWTVRNAVQLEAFVPVSTSAGPGLAGTYNPTSAGLPGLPGQWQVPWNDPTMRAIAFDQQHETEAVLDARLRDASLTFIADNPTYPFETAAGNLVRLFDLDGGSFARIVARHIPYPSGWVMPSVIASWILLALAGLGVAKGRLRHTPGWLWVAPGTMLVFMIFTVPASIRYRLTLEPFTVLLAAAGIAALLTGSATAGSVGRDD